MTLIDIENITGTPSPTWEEIQVAKAGLCQVVAGFNDAQHIVACSHHAAPVAAFAFPKSRHLWRSGPDGADLALLDVLTNESVGQRFDRVTICSGDGIFAASVAWLAEENVDVTVVSLPGHLNAHLNLAAKQVVFLPVEAIVCTESAS